MDLLITVALVALVIWAVALGAITLAGSHKRSQLAEVGFSRPSKMPHQHEDELEPWPLGWS
jgi:hypothetical protein